MLFWSVLACAGQDTDRAIARYKEMLERSPAPGTALERLWSLHEASGRTEELIADYADKAAAGDFAAALLHGYFLEKNGAVEEARTAFQNAAALKPEDPRPHEAIGRLELAANRPAEAALAFEAALEKTEEPSKRADLLMELGRAHAAAGERAKASEAWEAILELRPGDLSVHERLARAYRESALLEEAVPHYQAIADRGEPYARVEALRELASLHRQLGDDDAAIAALERGMAAAVAGNWLREELQTELIRLHRRLGRVPELEERWIAYVEANPRDLGGYLQLVALYRETAEVDRQRQWLERLVEVAPQVGEYQRELAALHELENAPEKAARIYDRLLEERPEDGELLLARARLDVRMGATSAVRERLRPLEQDESMRQEVLAFYREHRMWPMVERLLEQAANENGTPEDILAFADFLFAQGKRAEARRALRALVSDADSTEEQAAAWARMAEVLREHSEPGASADAIRRAIELAPGNAVYRAALGRMLSATGDTEAALAAFENAVDLSEDETARAQADRELFQFLNAGQSSEDAPGLPAYLAGIRKEAESRATVPAVMRAARWLMWNGDVEEAARFARQAIELDPEAVAPHALAASIAEAAGRLPEALVELQALAELDPENAKEHRRSAARMQLEAGHVEESIFAYETLVQEHPVDASLLSDLALAYQRADRWYDALDAWQRAYEAGGATGRDRLAQPMVRVMERLGMHDRALGLLIEAIENGTDETARSGYLRDLLQYATAHQRMEGVLEEVEKRQRRRPGDVFLQSALAQLLWAARREDEALELLREAALSSSDPVPALEEYVTEAEAAGRVEEAIQAQQRLAWQRAPIRAEDFLKLAELREKWMDLAGARDAWTDAVGRFPRDPEVLREAAEFYARWQYLDQARETLRRLQTLEPRDPAALMILGDLAAGSGATREALAAYEQVLASTTPKAPGERLQFPEQSRLTAGRLQQSYMRAARSRNGRPDPRILQQMQEFWTPGDSAEEKNPRLEAIRNVAELRLASHDGLDAWLRDWDRRREQAPVEALWAYFYAGDGGRVFRQLAILRDQRPEDASISHAFVWLALQLGAYEAVLEWLEAEGRTPEERDAFAVAFGQFLAEAESSEIRKMTPRLFPESFRFTQVLWQAASQLAAQNYLAEAARLGERVFEDSRAVRAQYGGEVGTWYLTAGDLENARRVWLAAAESGGGGFDDGSYEALRRYALTLAPEERREFAREYIESAAEEKGGVDAAIVQVLLAGIEREETVARAGLNRLIDMRTTAGIDDFNASATQRYWRFILTTGIRLQMWDMNRLAVYLWEEALADEAALKLQGEAENLVREAQLRLAAARIANSLPAEAAVRTAQLVRVGRPEELFMVSSILEGGGYFDRSVSVLKRVLESDPTNAQYLRGMLNVARAGNDPDAAREAIHAAIETGIPQPGLLEAFAAQFVEFFISQQLYDEALAVLDRVEPQLGARAQWLGMRARILTMQGDLEKAEAIQRTLVELDDRNGMHRMQLAEILKQTGRMDEAIEQLKAVPAGFNVEMTLAELHLANGDREAARRWATHFSGGDSGGNLAELASAFAAAGDHRFGQALLYAASEKESDPARGAWLQARALEWVEESSQEELRRQGLARLKVLVSASGGSMEVYYEARAASTGQESPPQDELRADWAAGVAEAGARLARLAADEGDEKELLRILDSLLSDEDAPFAILASLGDALEAAGRMPEALRVVESLLTRAPRQEGLPFERIRLLRAAGKENDALAATDRLAANRALNPALADQVAATYIEAGATERAEAIYREAIAWDAAAKQVELFNGYARLLIEQQRIAEARDVLKRAFRNRRNTDAEVLVEFLAAKEAMDRPEEVMADLDLPAVVRNNVYAAVVRRLREVGRAEAAAELLTRHTELIFGGLVPAADVEEVAQAADRTAEIVEILELAMAEDADLPSEAKQLLGRLYLYMADRAGDPQGETTGWLERAHELLPGDPDAAHRLAGRYVSSDDTEAAREVWRRVLEATTDPAVTARAREALARLSQ